MRVFRALRFGLGTLAIYVAASYVVMGLAVFDWGWPAWFFAAEYRALFLPWVGPGMGWAVYTFADEMAR